MVRERRLCQLHRAGAGIQVCQPVLHCEGAGRSPPVSEGRLLDQHHLPVLPDLAGLDDLCRLHHARLRLEHSGQHALRLRPAVPARLAYGLCPVHRLRPHHEEQEWALRLRQGLLRRLRDLVPGGGLRPHPVLRGAEIRPARLLQAVPAGELLLRRPGCASPRRGEAPVLPLHHADRHVQRLPAPRRLRRHQRALLQRPAHRQRGDGLRPDARVPQPRKVHRAHGSRLPRRHQPEHERRPGPALLAGGAEPQLGRLHPLPEQAQQLHQRPHQQHGLRQQRWNHPRAAPSSIRHHLDAHVDLAHHRLESREDERLPELQGPAPDGCHGHGAPHRAQLLQLPARDRLALDVAALAADPAGDEVLLRGRQAPTDALRHGRRGQGLHSLGAAHEAQVQAHPAGARGLGPARRPRGPEGGHGGGEGAEARVLL
mmetsp:Transcript_49777/g.144438  ORF Transcript_49777/g.144438 Transcript_49777/m.144438 type:complete len:428 (-) Transcript_49777:608-1891(-)